MKRKKSTSISVLKKRADATFSKWVRARDGNRCFTCDREGNQAGHYISRSINILRFDERNVHCQCTPCNIFKHGNIPEYAMRLADKYGFDFLKDLQRRKQQLHQFTRQELEAIIAKYSV